MNNDLMNYTENDVIETESGIKGRMVYDLTMFDSTNTNMICTIKAETMQEKKHLYNALQNATGRMDDILNIPFDLKDVIIHPVQIVDNKTGEVEDVLRTVLIDKDGSSYEGVTMGILTSLKRIFDIFGRPETWEEPLTVKLVKRDTKNGNKMTTIELV